MAHRQGERAVAYGTDPTARALFEALQASIPSGLRVRDVTVGLHWTGVVAEAGGRLHCGLASTVIGEHPHAEFPDVARPGELAKRPLRELAGLTLSQSPTERAVGLAAINAFLSGEPGHWIELDAASAIAARGAGKRIALIGHFSFIPKLRRAADRLFVLEQDPGPEEYPAEAAAEVLPTCDVVALTSMTLLNGTFGSLMRHVPDRAYVVLLGPSSPLSPRVHDFGVHLIAGTIVTDIEPVIAAIQEGANYRQIHRIGTRLVSLVRPEGAENGDRPRN